MKKNKLTLLHVIILIIGSALFIGGCFQNSIWFDEVYTVALVRHPIPEMIDISISDVHPPLYYIMLKIVTLIFGDSYTVVRLFSAVGGILLASLGLTLIRRDYGERVGFWYSFCTCFFGSVLFYSLQMRMYTWVALFIALTAIYAMRAYKNPNVLRYRVLFITFSVLSAYTQHFALFTVGVLNLILLIIILRGSLHEPRPDLKRRLVDGAIQIALYIPGAVIFLLQIINGGASWIKIKWPDLFFDLATYHLTGEPLFEVFERYGLFYNPAGGIAMVLYGLGIYFTYKLIKRNTEITDALKAAIATYYGVILFSLSVSLFRAIYYIRYTMVIIPLFCFIVAIVIAYSPRLWQRITAGAVILCLFTVCAANIYNIYYHETGDDIIECIDALVEDDDIFLFDDIDGYIVSEQFTDNQAYFYNTEEWTVHDAYRAFGSNCHVIESMDTDFGGRVWVLNEGPAYEALKAQGYMATDVAIINQRYQKLEMMVILMEQDYR